MVVLAACKNKDNPIKIGLEWSQHFPNYKLMELSVARVPIRFCPERNAAFTTYQ